MKIETHHEKMETGRLTPGMAMTHYDSGAGRGVAVIPVMKASPRFPSVGGFLIVSLMMNSNDNNQM